MTRAANLNGTIRQLARNFAARARRLARAVPTSLWPHRDLTGSALLPLMLLMSTLIVPGTTLAQGFAPGPTPPLLEPLGSKLVGTGASGAAIQGANVAISADGNTAIVGGPLDNGSVGAAWIYVQNPHGVWSQQGTKLVASNEVGGGFFGGNVAMSGDGNIAAIGAPSDNGGVGAVWIFTRAAGTWTQQMKLVGTGATGNAGQASSVALSLDGTTLVEGGQNDNSGVGGVWVFTQSGGVWTQQGDELIASDGTGGALQGFYVAVSAQGNTLVEGGPGDNSGVGAAWVFQRTAGSWSQVGSKLVGSGSTGNAAQGSSVAISGDGATLVEGGSQDNSQVGGVWIFALSCSTYSQVTGELIPAGANFGDQVGTSVAMSRDGDLIFVGAPEGNEGAGYVSEFVSQRGVWSQLGSNLAATDGDFAAAQGGWVSISADGNTAIEGGAGDTANTGAAWIFSTQVNFGSTTLYNTVTQTIVIQPQIQALEGIVFGGYQVVIQGAASQDYNLSSAQPGSGTCSTGMVVVYPGTCTLNIDFTPTIPGLRPGAIEIFDNSTPPILVTTVYLNGTGVGPLLGVTSGVIITIAGNGTIGYSGDGGPAVNAELHGPSGPAVDGGDNLYVADLFNDSIREINANTLVITTVAGNGTQGSSGNGGPATSAQFSEPFGVAIDAAGNLFICDTFNSVIREVQPSVGIVTIVAGSTFGDSGDGGAATSAQLKQPQSIVFDQLGNYYIADAGTNTIRKVNTSGIISTVAGTPESGGFTGDGGPATSATLNVPVAVAIDASGNLYIDDDLNNVIRRVDATTGIITSFIGVPGDGGFSGDGGPAVTAELNDPEGLTLDAAGNFYIADAGNSVVRSVSASSGIINTIAGTPTVFAYSGDGAAATAATLNYPVEPVVDNRGDLFIADQSNNRERLVSGAAPLVFGTVNVGSASQPLSFSISNNGNAVLPLEGFYINGDFSFGSATTCNGSSVLNPGDSCLVTVVFTPTQPGSRTGSVGVGDPIVNLSGTGQLVTTTTTLTTSPNPATVGAAVTFTAAVTPAPTGSALGTVDFSDGATLLGTVNVNSSGMAVFMTSSLTSGMHDITAAYSGNSGFATSTSGTLTETINAATTTSTALTGSPNPAGVGASVTFTAAVSPAPTGNPTGTVSFCLAATEPDLRLGRGVRMARGRTKSARGNALNPNGASVCGEGTLLGTGTVSGSGVATFTTSGLAAGPQTITAVYSGNAGFATSTSSALTETINPAAATLTTTTLTGSPNPATVGAAVTFTAAVSPVPTGSSLGTVSFSDGATLLGTVNLNASGMAVFMTSSLNVAAHSITAVYSGNTGFATSTSSTLTETINPGAATTTTTSLTGSPNPAAVGAVVTFTATISPVPTGTPTGTVSFCSATTEPDLRSSAGARTSRGRTSAARSETLHPNVPNACGAGTLLGTGTVSVSGVATFMTSSLTAAAYSITAVYSGNTGFATSTSSALTETINPAAATTTTTSLTGSPNPATLGAAVTFTAAVSPVPTGSSLGTVSFSDGATLLGAVNLNASGMAVFMTSSLTVAAHSIIAVYSGNTGFATSTSSTLTETINPAAATTTTTSLTGSPNAATVGTAVTFTAAVSPVPTGSSLGTVNFYDGETLLGTVNLNASGMAVFMTSSLTVAAHSIIAVYSGNTGFAASTSTALTETINPLTPTATTTTLAASPNPAAVGADVTFTATISPVPTGTPTGTVSFCSATTEPELRPSTGARTSRGRTSTTHSNALNPNNVSGCGSGTLLGTGTVSVSGIATFMTSSLAIGTYSVTAVYSGNAAFAASTSTAVSQVINPLTPTVTTLLVSPNPAGAGQSITFTGTVAPMPVGAPLGTITFSAGEGSIGTAAVNPVGVATITLTAPSETGTFTITAVYSGNALFATSTSAGLSVTLVPAFGVTAPQTPFPLAQGGLVTVAVTVPPIGGAFNNVVTLSATGQPLGSTVTFNPPMVTPGAAGTTTMMTVQLPSLIAGVPAGVSTENLTEVSSGGLPRPPGRHIPLTPISVAAMAALLLSRAFGKKRMARFGLATATLAAVLLVIAGCKGGLAGGSSTPPGNYVITITGTSGNLHASTTVTIVVSK